MHQSTCTCKCIVLLLLLTTVCRAQSFNNWYFGYKAGISFNTPTPTLLAATPMVQHEGCAAISDKTGALLFYTDGITVWDKNNSVMPNGSGLGGSITAAQSALIIPMPGDEEKYYLFTVEDESRSGDLRYSIVDMKLNAGNGDIVPGAKNIFLSTNNTEALVAANPVNCNTFVITHERNNNRFRVRLVSDGGIGAGVISDVGSIHNAGNFTGIMKVSNKNQNIAITTGGRVAELFAFSPLTGKIDYPISLPITAPYMCYGICFSPDDSKLYVTEAAGSQGNGYKIFQYDLTVNDAASIVNSKTLVGLVQAPLGVAGDLQVAPDNKIYFTRPMVGYLGVIPFPNLKAPLCGFINDGISLGTGYCYFGLPNQPRIGNTVPKFRLGNDTIICPGASVTLQAPVAPAYNWSTGATSQTITVSTTGTYWGMASSGGCSTRDTINIEVKVPPPPPFPPDTVGCKKEHVLTLDAGNALKYAWSTGDTTQTVSISQPGHYSLAMDYYAGCPPAQYATNVTFENCEFVLSMPNAFTPNNDGKNDIFKPADFGGYKFQRFAVYNRWGQQVYGSNNLHNGWDGKWNGVVQGAGLYVWLVTGMKEGKTHVFRGTVMLIR